MFDDFFSLDDEAFERYLQGIRDDSSAGYVICLVICLLSTYFNILVHVSGFEDDESDTNEWLTYCFLASLANGAWYTWAAVRALRQQTEWKKFMREAQMLVRFGNRLMKEMADRKKRKTNR